MDTMLYFAYGSNMSIPRLTERLPSAQAVTCARLYKHRLKFHKRGQDGSGKCDIESTFNTQDVVHGVVYQIARPDKPALDSKEGLGSGYEEKNVTVISPNCEVLVASTYYATRIDVSLAPYDWYKEHVLRGAHEHSLPPEYIAGIEGIQSMPDSNKNRAEKELSIYD